MAFHHLNALLFYFTETASAPINLDLLLFIGLPLVGCFLILGIVVMLFHFKHKKKMESLSTQEQNLLGDDGIRAQQVGDSTLGVGFMFILFT